jgi:hypothetical protein
VRAIEHSADSMRAVVRGGKAMLFDVIYPALGCGVRSELASALGAKTNDVGCLEVDSHQRTTRWMGSMLPETSCRISTRSPLPPVTLQSQRPIFTSRCRKTSKAWTTPSIPRPHESKTALHRNPPCAGSSGIPADCLLSHRSITAATCFNSAGRSAWPFPMPCHFARQPITSKTMISSWTVFPPSDVVRWAGERLNAVSPPKSSVRCSRTATYFRHRKVGRCCH